MKDGIITVCQKYMEKLYLVSKKQLLDKGSYTQEDVDFENARRFITFLEKALKKPYNRLHSLNAFINNDGALSTDLMYPFCFLSGEIKADINKRDTEAIDLATGLDSGRIDPELKTLCREEHLHKATEKEVN